MVIRDRLAPGRKRDRQANAAARLASHFERAVAALRPLAHAEQPEPLPRQPPGRSLGRRRRRRVAGAAARRVSRRARRPPSARARVLDAFVRHSCTMRYRLTLASSPTSSQPAPASRACRTRPRDARSSRPRDPRARASARTRRAAPAAGGAACHGSRRARARRSRRSSRRPTLRQCAAVVRLLGHRRATALIAADRLPELVVQLVGERAALAFLDRDRSAARGADSPRGCARAPRPCG